jgi:ArsR family transcriptional regulator, arsenate/arsenite/antimonite-responsive transcriptional repressor
MEREKVLNALSAMASGTRLDLLRGLIAAGESGLSAGRIAADLGLSASRLSFHLAALEQSGLITARRDGRNIFYAADHAGLGGVIGYLLHDCCGGHPKVCCSAGHPGGTAAAWPTETYSDVAGTANI